MGQTKSFFDIEWITLGLIGLTYGWCLASLWMLPTHLAIPALALAIALHASLQHEVIHGHPTPWQTLNAAIVWLPLSLVVPYARFRDTHLAHHNDPTLTDPYDDPESNYLDPAIWARLPKLLRNILVLNNTLAGRMLLGPLIGSIAAVYQDWRDADKAVLSDWLFHIPMVGVVLSIVWLSPIPIGAYLVAAYAALSILKLRTYLEHQAHERASGRSVIIEDRGIFAFLFLNNNLHVVHHMHPKVPWYQLPRLYRSRRAHYVKRNHGYVYRSYRQIIGQYFLRAKDPVPHPLWRR